MHAYLVCAPCDFLARRAHLVTDRRTKLRSHGDGVHLARAMPPGLPALVALALATVSAQHLAATGSQSIADDLATCQHRNPRSIVPLGRTSTFAPNGILVHLHYYGDAAMEPCELTNKWTNLVQLINVTMLIKHPKLEFLVTSSGKLPNVTEVYRSIGAPPPARATLFPSHVSYEEVGQSKDKTDLCPRAAVLRRMSTRVNPPSYILFLNDGARGPYPNPGSQQSSVQLGVPLWLARYASAFAEDSGVRAVGTALSCEMDLHLQSWALMIDWSVKVC